MKCPECGQWNRASMPHCTRCGAKLNIDAASRLAWKDTLRDEGQSTAYIRVDEFGTEERTPDSRDTLAREMQELKTRKREGEARKQKMLENAPESRGVTVEEEAGEKNGEIRMRRVSAAGLAAAQEAEIRHRVRYMDDTGTFIEPRSYDPVHENPMEPHRYDYAPSLGKKPPSRARTRKRMMIALLALILAAALGTGGYYTWRYFQEGGGEDSFLRNMLAPVLGRPAGTYTASASVTATMMDDLAAHTILIPGEEGTQIYIRELHASYMVTDGFATVQVADHTWYDNYEGTLEETMDVTLTPFLKTSAGRQTPLEPIQYTIFIPLSPITLDSPDSLRTEVATTMSTIQITVRPGSRVTVNGVDCSDTVSSETGVMSYNATVQPIGDNVFEIRVRSQYCRDNAIHVTLYRAPQEIPLDLAVGTYGTTYERVMKVSATTLPGAYVEVSSPYTDLDITNLDSTGKFTFNAVFDHIGNNTISITASYPGRKPSEVQHTVYYVPPASEYTVKAWPLSAEGYSELLSNMAVRSSYGQVYVVTGVVQYAVSEKPQMVVINTSEDGRSQPVLVQNYSRTVWEVGQYYRLYADAYSTYNSMPWLNARYTYTK